MASSTLGPAEYQTLALVDTADVPGAMSARGIPEYLLVGAPAAINATLYSNLSFNVIRDIAPVASIDRSPLVMEVNTS